MNKCDINVILAYLKGTPEESWCTEVVRTKEGQQNCLLGHLFEMGKDKKESNQIIDYFEAAWANTFMFYPVNDGKHPNYQQETPKQRIIAYIQDLVSGKEKTIMQLWDEMCEET